MIAKSLKFAKSEKVALMMIDLQPVFTENELIKGAFPKLATNIKSVLTSARNRNMDIVHLRANYTKNRSKFFPMSTKLTPHVILEYHDTSAQDWAKEVEGEEVVAKWTWDGFHDTPLNTIL